jgi:hypothetical protein
MDMGLPSEGYVYVPDVEKGPFLRAYPGAHVRNKDRRPPWIVVNHSIATTIVAKWPGRLWRVSEIDAELIPQVSAEAPCTRASAVKVCEELPVSRLFGPRGEAMCCVLERGAQLDLPQVHALASSRHPDAGDAFSRAWHKWLTEMGRSIEHEGQNLSSTVGAGVSGLRSPVNCGFTVLHRVVWDRANSILGSAAFVIDEEGENDLEPSWQSAANSMLEAAMAFGAPQLSEPADRDILLTAWRAVFGDITV